MRTPRSGSFAAQLAVLLNALDQPEQADGKARLARCRSVRDLDRIAETDLGWLQPASSDPRLRLVKHNSGTFLVLSYADGWGTTLVQQGFRR